MLMSLTNSTLRARVIYVIPLLHFISCIFDGDAACGGQRLEKRHFVFLVPGLWSLVSVPSLGPQPLTRVSVSVTVAMFQMLHVVSKH